MMRRYQLAVMPGDGIGLEVIAESVETLTSLAVVDGGFDFDVQHFDWGTERYLREGAMIPALEAASTRGQRTKWRSNRLSLPARARSGSCATPSSTPGSMAAKR